MKLQKWIIGPVAVIFGLGAQNTLLAQSQDAVELNEIAVAPKAAAAKTVKVAPAKASAPQILPTLSVWNSQSKTNAARVGAWGNGAAQSTRGRGGTTLQVTTRNFEEGARFDLSKPLDIAPYKQTGFWHLKVQISGASGSSRRPTRAATPGAPAAPLGTTVEGAAPPLTQLRLTLLLERGAMSGLIPVAQSSGRRGRGRDNSQNLLLRVRSMASTPGASGAVKRILLTGDSTASFGLEQVALVAETNKITATVRRASDPAGTDLKDITVKPGRGTALLADVNAGTSDAIVAWNFNAANSPAYPAAPVRGRGGAMMPDGANFNRPRVDAIGLSATPDWPNEEQDYRVEVTIVDRAGKKARVKKSFSVKVRNGA